VAEPQAVCIIHKDMGVSHGDFWRIIPAALSGFAWRRDNNVITAEDGGRRLVIRLATEGVHRIAALSIPMTRVTLEFSGFTTEERESFLARFYRRFQRGGG